MVQVIENRADVEGRVVAVKEHPEHPGQQLVTLEVTGVDDVPGYPNLLSWAVGQTLEVTAREVAATTAAAAGTRVRWRLKKAGPNTVVMAGS